MGVCNSVPGIVAAREEVLPDGFRVRDLESKNGTFLRLRETVKLRDGDVIVAVVGLAGWVALLHEEEKQRSGDALAAGLDAGRDAQEARQAAQQARQRIAQVIAPVRAAVDALAGAVDDLRARAQKAEAGFADVIRAQRPAIVRVLERKAGGWTPIGTGFCVSPKGTIVTNRQVAAAIPHGAVGVLFAHVKDSSPIDAQVLTLSADPEVDLALLKLNLPDAIALPYIDVRPSADLRPNAAPEQGVEVVTLGFPGLFSSVSVVGEGTARQILLAEPSQSDWPPAARAATGPAARSAPPAPARRARCTRPAR